MYIDKMLYGLVLSIFIGNFVNNYSTTTETITVQDPLDTHCQ